MRSNTVARQEREKLYNEVYEQHALGVHSLARLLKTRSLNTSSYYIWKKKRDSKKYRTFDIKMDAPKAEVFAIPEVKTLSRTEILQLLVVLDSSNVAKDWSFAAELWQKLYKMLG